MKIIKSYKNLHEIKMKIKSCCTSQATELYFVPVLSSIEPACCIISRTVGFLLCLVSTELKLLVILTGSVCVGCCFYTGYSYCLCLCWLLVLHCDSFYSLCLTWLLVLVLHCGYYYCLSLCWLLVPIPYCGYSYSVSSC
jgi:hypothetical protein